MKLLSRITFQVLVAFLAGYELHAECKHAKIIKEIKIPEECYPEHLCKEIKLGQEFEYTAEINIKDKNNNFIFANLPINNRNEVVYIRKDVIEVKIKSDAVCKTSNIMNETDFKMKVYP